MGGGSSSSVKTDIYTKNVVEAFAKTIQNCQGNTVIQQRVEIRGDYNVVKGVRMVQGMRLSSSCALDDKNIAQAQQAVATAIKQQAAAQNVALLGALGHANSKSDVEIHNEVRSAITRETVQTIINNFNATQDFYLNGNSNIVGDISMEQSMEVLYTNCLAALSQIASVQDIKNNAEQSASAVQTNPVSDIINSIGGIISSMGAMWTIIIVVALIIGGYILVNGGFAMLTGGSAPDPARPIANPYGPPNPGHRPGGPPGMLRGMPPMQPMHRPPMQAMMRS